DCTEDRYIPDSQYSLQKSPQDSQEHAIDHCRRQDGKNHFLCEPAEIPSSVLNAKFAHIGTKPLNQKRGKAEELDLRDVETHRQQGSKIEDPAVFRRTAVFLYIVLLGQIPLQQQLAESNGSQNNNDQRLDGHKNCNERDNL